MNVPLKTRLRRIVVLATAAAITSIFLIRTGRIQSSQPQEQEAHEVQPYNYIPARLEQYFIDRIESLGLSENKAIKTCPLIFNDTSPINGLTQRYFQELEVYNKRMKEFQSMYFDIRHDIFPGEANIERVCSAVKIHPDGVEGIFKSSGISSSTHAGAMEPLLPVMRSQKICQGRRVSHTD
jgi:hypothetical protein